MREQESHITLPANERQIKTMEQGKKNQEGKVEKSLHGRTMGVMATPKVLKGMHGDKEN